MQPFKGLGSHRVLAQDFVDAFKKFLGPFFCMPNFDLFFFLECGRCRAEARSLHESKHGMQRQGQKVLGNGKSIEATKTKTTTKPKATTRKSPSQTCVSPAETAKQTAETKQEHKTGPGPKPKHPPNRFAIGRSGKSTASLSKTCHMN